jgi:putative nucleotidyltransferase with HDIG domain
MTLVECILNSAIQLPPFPAVIQRVLQLVEEPKSSAQEIVDVIQYDQSITANILRVCNSAFSGLRRPVHSLREAIALIGFNQLVEVILQHNSAQLISRACPGYDLDDGELWRHSVSCALLSQIISLRLNQAPSPTRFTAALLHDIGKVILSGFVREHFEEIRKIVRDGGCSFSEAEREVLGIDHAELGGKISERWQFPKAIVLAIRYHHTPLLTPEDHEIVNLIYLCDLVTLMMGIGGGADGLSYHAHKEVLDQNQLNRRDIEQFISQLDEGFKKVEATINLESSP